MTPAEIAAEVAVRYGVSVCPSVVQLCPPCTFTTTTPLWNGQDLVYSDAEERKVARKKARWAHVVASNKASPATRARRAEVIRLHGEGLSIRQISERLECSYSTAKIDHTACGLTPNAYATSAMTQSKVQADRIKVLHALGWSGPRIAEMLGVVKSTVYDLALLHHGIRFMRQKKRVAA